jgi:hypothetical protein
MPALPTDLLVIGKVNRERLERLIRDFERELGASVRFTVLTGSEFQYRKQVGDKFIYSVLGAEEGRRGRRTSRTMDHEPRNTYHSDLTSAEL